MIKQYSTLFISVKWVRGRRWSALNRIKTILNPVHGWVNRLCARLYHPDGCLRSYTRSSIKSDATYSPLRGGRLSKKLLRLVFLYAVAVFRHYKHVFNCVTDQGSLEEITRYQLPTYKFEFWNNRIDFQKDKQLKTKLNLSCYPSRSDHHDFGIDNWVEDQAQVEYDALVNDLLNLKSYYRYLKSKTNETKPKRRTNRSQYHS